ncbi:AbrB/MazE/SpoVT family DNA-binding domain-containing protein [Desulfococcus sp.]|uniref:AbrB/MazE/SpoVT family DNA-binding domain-containing protein n=1 Tax=Desulfococcus sp. TaxID=2025834 RepID=UPI003593BB78
MAVATLTTKGQVTIPKEIRDYLQLHTGDKIEIVVTENREAVIRPISKKVDDAFGKLYKTERKPVSIEVMDEAVREKMKDRWK